VIDAAATTAVDEVSEVQALADAVQNVMDGAAGTADTPTKADLEALGITGVTDDNLAAIQQAVAGTDDDGSGVDDLTELQSLVDDAVTAATAGIDAIKLAADENDAVSDNLALSHFTDAGVTGVSNLGAIQSALDSTLVDGTAVNSSAKIQAVVDSYNTILAAADGTADNTATDPSSADYTAIGVTGVDDAEEASLLGDVIDAAATTAVDEVSEVQALADAVQNVMDGAAGDASKPSQEELEALGITGVSSDIIAAIQAAIGATSPSGSGVDSLEKLQLLVNELAPVVTNVSIDADGTGDTLKVGDTLTVTVTYSQDVTVATAVGLTVASIGVDIGSVTQQATYASSLNSKQLVFEYVILAADLDENGVSISTNAILVNNSVIANVEGKVAGQNHNALPDNNLFKVDAVAPTNGVTIVSITEDAGTYDNDFITNDNSGLTIVGSLGQALQRGERLMYSVDGGSSWTEVSSAVTDVTFTHVDNSITSSTNIQFAVFDTVGNVGPIASQNIVIDIVGPEAPGIIASSKGTDGLTTLDGIAESNAQVHIYDNSVFLATVTANVTGEWMHTIVSALSEGNHSFTSAQTDLAGNGMSAVSEAHSLDIVLPAITEQNQPLTFETSQFSGSSTTGQGAIEKIKIVEVTERGNLQVFLESGWTTVNVDGISNVITMVDIESGQFRFVPINNESGDDSYGGTGTGNGESDYAFFRYLVSDGASWSEVFTKVIDVTPVADEVTFDWSVTNYVGTSPVVAGQYKNDQQIVSLTDGNYLVVWELEHHASRSYTIKGQVYDANGNVTGNELNLGTTRKDNKAGRIEDISSAEEGGFSISYVEGSTFGRYFVKTYAQDGSVLRSSVSNENTVTDVIDLGHGNGSAHIYIHQQKSSSSPPTGRYVKTFDNDNVQTSNFSIPKGGSTEFNSGGVINSSGDFVIVDSIGNMITASRYSKLGVSGGSWDIYPSVGGHGIPDVAGWSNSLGQELGFMVLSLDISQPQLGTYLTIIGNDASMSQTEIDLDIDFVDSVHVEAMAGGGAIIVGYGREGGNYVVFSRWVDGEGGLLGETYIHAQQNVSFYDVTATALSAGGFAISWSEGNNREARIEQFDTNGVVVRSNGGVEDVAIQLHLPSAIQEDSSEALSFELLGIPQGVVVTGVLDNDGSVVSEPAVSGSAVNITGWDLGSVKLTPANNYNGQFTLQFQATTTSSNGSSNQVVSDIVVTVNAVGEGVDQLDSSINTLENVPYVLSLNDFDYSPVAGQGAIEEIRITALESAGDLQWNDGVAWVDVTLNQVVSANDIADGLLRYTPNGNTVGATHDSFNFELSDGVYGPDSAAMLAINSAPLSVQTLADVNGDGNDVIKLTAANLDHLEAMVGGATPSVDGGAGIDLLMLVGNGLHLDFAAFSGSRIQGIEILDISGDGANLATLSASDVLNISTTTNTLVVDGDLDDKLTANGFQDIGSTQLVNGVDYNVYAANANDAVLWVDPNVVVVF